MKATNINTGVNFSLLPSLKRELQEYYDNAAKGGILRRRNMVLLRWDIRKMERKIQNA